MAWTDLTWRQLALRLATAAVVWSLAAPLALFFVLTLLLRFVWSPRSGFWRPKPRDQPPEALLDTTLGQHEYVTLAKGIKLHYVHNGDTNRPLMLFLHGFPEFWYSWKHQLQEFAKDYWVVAVDMRGYGDSDKPSGTSSYRADILVDDVRELLDAFERPRASLVGHGWGAAVAWMFLERYPERVERLASIGAPHPYVFQRALALNRKQLKRSWYFFLFQVPWVPELVLRCDDLACLSAALRRGRRHSPTVTDQDLEAYKYTFGKSGALTGPLNYYRAAGWGLPRRWRPHRCAALADDVAVDEGITPDEKEPKTGESVAKEDEETEDVQQNNFNAADSTTPPSPTGSGAPDGTADAAPAPSVLVLLGGRDAYVEHSTAFRTRKQFPNVSVVIVRDANHFAHLDDPAAVNRHLRKFMAAD
ncbi:Epoxide hydrolase 4-like [Frankliniella occidentalis]|uniref:Epoxide hydrolase 4-like n=1 Tax=Frankliniella occidentalis TaxID=133901 RepID=A0A6J1SHE6_FRAOC|nr:epoxide hydrolase 4-like [Frankliniella occidentalis]KAE8737088.1 Epoxide hydrolase 4-like [Frankliniella occidentalis]